MIPAGDAAKGYIAAGFNLPGTSFPVMQDVLKHVYEKGKGEMEDKSRIGSIYHTRGVVAGIITAEAIRKAQERFGKGKPITGEQVRWGIENLNIDEKRLKELGAAGLMQPLKVSCMDHEGGGAVQVPAVGRQALERDQRLDRVRPVDRAADDRGLGRAVREGEEASRRATAPRRSRLAKRRSGKAACERPCPFFLMSAVPSPAPRRSSRSATSR